MTSPADHLPASRVAQPLRDITDRQSKADPYPYYARLRANQPVARARMGKLDAWLVTRYADVASLLKDERFVKAQQSVQSPAQQAQRPKPAPTPPLFQHAQPAPRLSDTTSGEHFNLGAAALLLPPASVNLPTCCDASRHGGGWEGAGLAPKPECDTTAAQP